MFIEATSVRAAVYTVAKFSAFCCLVTSCVKFRGEMAAICQRTHTLEMVKRGALHVCASPPCAATNVPDLPMIL